MFSVRSFSLAAKAKQVILSPWVWRASTSVIRESSDNKLPTDTKKCLDSVNETHSKHWEDSSIGEKSLIHLLTPIEPSRGLQLHDLVEAFTVNTDGNYNMNQIQMLGDAFIKFGSTLYLIQRYSDRQVDELLEVRDEIMSARNLFYHAVNAKLPEMMFVPEDNRQPPVMKTPDCAQNSSVCGEAASESEREPIFICDADVVNCLKALFGCCVKSYGVPRSFKILETLKILPSMPDKDIMKMLDQKLESTRIRTNITDSEVDSFLINSRTLERNIGYTFKDRAYLLQALTHPSYPTNHITDCYLLLQFLGDAVLNLLVTAYIFERCPDMDKGTLADLHSALLNNETLACLCVRSNIHEHILSQGAELSESIANFSKFQSSKRHEIAEHVQLLMEENGVDCKMAKCVSPKVPKALGDVFQAVIGGIFSDSGNDLHAEWNKIYKLMGKELEGFMRDVPIGFVRKLKEFPNANPEFDEFVARDGGFEVNLRFTCNGEIQTVHGSGTTQENAKRAAAKAALYNLQKCARE